MDSTTQNPPEMDCEPVVSHTLRALSIFEEGDSISFAFYDEESDAITLETSQAFGHDTTLVVEAFRSGMLEPSIVVVSNRIAQNGPLLALILGKQPGSPQAQASDGPPSTLPYKVLSTASYDLRSSHAAITNQLNVKSLSREQEIEKLRHNAVSFPSPPRASEQLHKSRAGTTFHSLSTVINFDAPTEVRALGGLLAYLRSTVFRLEQDQIVSVASINSSAQARYMRATPTALKALHVFSEERHPLIAKGYGQSKEGFSLYSLLNRCDSKVGSKCLRQWMLRPLIAVEEIEMRQAGVELFMKPEMAQAVAEMRKHLSAVADVPSVLMRMHKCLAKPLDFLALNRSVDAGLKALGVLHGVAKTAAMPNPAHAYFIASVTAPADAGALEAVAKRIEETVDDELTKDANKVCIKDGFSADLDHAKQRFDELDDLLSRVGLSIANRYPDAGPLNVMFMPQVGFLVLVDSSIDVNIPDFVFTFSNEGQNYYKCSEMYTLDDQEGDLDALINDTEALIAAELEDEILDYDLELRKTFQALAELDCVIAFSSVAAEMNFVRPHVVDDDERTVLVENGRSPLQELVTDHRYIPNDVQLTSSLPIGMITGPNFSGKSCYMSMVGVLVYLAQIGSFVPADKARFSVVDQILVRIASVETCAVPQSAFQIDLTQVGHILRQSTKKSLVLIDEFGKGTATASGMSLLAAAIDHLSSVGCRVICTTHFLELFSLGLLETGRGGVQCYKMSTYIPTNKNEDAVPLFRLEMGVAHSSDGLLCAKMAGVDSTVLGRSAEILNAIQKGNPIKSVNSKEPVEGAKMLKLFLSRTDWDTATTKELKELLAIVQEYKAEKTEKTKK